MAGSSSDIWLLEVSRVPALNGVSVLWAPELPKNLYQLGLQSADSATQLAYAKRN